MPVTLDERAAISCVTAGKLQAIPRTEWPELRDLYRRDWPKNIVSYYTLKTFVEWLEKNPKMCDIHIYTTDGDWRLHGTFIAEDCNREVHFNTLEVEDQYLLQRALNSLDITEAYTLYAYAENVRPLAEKHLRHLGLTDFCSGYCPTLLYHMPKEKCLSVEVRSLMNGFCVRPLSVENVKQIDDLWPHQYPGSDYSIERLIRYNLTLGVFNECNGDLCAWVLQSEIGTIALLQVEMEYQRCGLGGYLVALMTKTIAQQKNMDAIANVMVENTPSRRIFEKLGFKVINCTYWYDKPAIEI